jgi:hypothetical protein
MRNLIKKILKEDVNFDPDWGWINDTNTEIALGPYLSDEGKVDVCFNSEDDCDLNLNYDTNEIILKLQYEELRDNFLDLNEGEESYFETVLDNHLPRDDYYEFDSDEFNYAGYHMNGDEKERLKNILFITTNSDFDLESYLIDTFNSLRTELKYPQIINYWDDLVSRYLNIIGYKVQENRWKSLRNYFEEITLHGEIPFKMYTESGSWGFKDVIVKAPLKPFIDLLSEGKIQNLESYFKNILFRKINNASWDDNFYEDWDTSGGEYDIRDAFDKFLGDVEEYLEEETEETSKFNKLYDMVTSLDFKPNKASWDAGNKFLMKDKEGSVWKISSIDLDEETLILSKHKTNRWSPDNRYSIKFEDLPIYITNYSLDL